MHILKKSSISFPLRSFWDIISFLKVGINQLKLDTYHKLIFLPSLGVCYRKILFLENLYIVKKGPFFTPYLASKRPLFAPPIPKYNLKENFKPMAECGRTIASILYTRFKRIIVLILMIRFGFEDSPNSYHVSYDFMITF